MSATLSICLADTQDWSTVWIAHDDDGTWEPLRGLLPLPDLAHGESVERIADIFYDHLCAFRGFTNPDLVARAGTEEANLILAQTVHRFRALTPAELSAPFNLSSVAAEAALSLRLAGFDVAAATRPSTQSTGFEAVLSTPKMPDQVFYVVEDMWWLHTLNIMRQPEQVNWWASVRGGPQVLAALFLAGTMDTLGSRNAPDKMYELRAGKRSRAESLERKLKRHLNRIVCADLDAYASDVAFQLYCQKYEMG
ncbi:hypothetical protein E3T61_03110 [Cryobacterium lactosi]|uniref:Uncharacterized protein n=1 Tax=Cryobacterium lactosi TaxID=1259202 RepID=A0A4R9BZ18_9MICO|nr:hypothetical protein [Cryobacterium lactosi]TFD94002.1 hypothetical protein E3T61_03110 [Cryobacterium lactosi]